VHLVGFIIRNDHDARSPERQILLIIGVIRSVFLGPYENLQVFECSVVAKITSPHNNKAVTFLDNK